MTDIRSVIDMVKSGLGDGGLWYLATPYAKYPMGKDAAATHAAKIAAELIKNDVAVFCPIAHGHLINLNGGPADRHDVWLPLDTKFMRFCCGIIVARMPGYHYSTGVKYEIDWFTKAGRPIIYIDVIDFLHLPEIFNEQSLSDEAEAKIMNEAQPKPVYDEVSGSRLDAPFPSTEEDYGAAIEAGIAGCGDPDCEACGEPIDPREGRQYRKDRPITSGVIDYFPLALAEVSRISALGNKQHNLGDSHLHWERTKSLDHADCIARHLADRGGVGLDGATHSGNLAWRALALLQEEEEQRLLNAGVNPIDVYSRAHTWHGKTKEEHWGPHYNDQAAPELGAGDIAATQWSQVEIDAMTEGRAPSEAYKFNKVPKYTEPVESAELQINWDYVLSTGTNICQIGPDTYTYPEQPPKPTPDEVREEARKAREWLRAQREEVKVLYKPARLFVYMNDGHFEQVPDTYSGTAVERTVVREDGLDYQGVVRT